MDSLYGDSHRALQDEFGTTRLADFLDKHHVQRTINEQDRGFIESRDMFFLSTVDAEGNPTVSYKGGPTGVVKVIGENEIAFPGYDGNGMFLSMGNITGQGKIGMLFIDFETPHRLRLQGVARLVKDDPLLAEFPEAQYVVRVDVESVCGELPALYSTATRGSSRAATSRNPAPTPRSPSGRGSISCSRSSPTRTAPRWPSKVSSISPPTGNSSPAARRDLARRDLARRRSRRLARHDEHPWKRQKAPPVRPGRVGGLDGARVGREEAAALLVRERIEERPQPGRAHPFDDGCGIHHPVVIRRVRQTSTSAASGASTS